MKNEYREKDFIGEQIECCREIEQQLAIPEFDKWLKDVGLWDDDQEPWSKIHFMTDELNLYNIIHRYKFYLRNNQIVHFWFIGSCGEVNFNQIDIDKFLEQNEYNFKYTHYMDLFLSIFTLGLHRRIIPWLIKYQENRNRNEIKKLKHKISTWKPGKS